MGYKPSDEVADWSAAIADHLRAHSDAEKIIVMRFLLDLIESLQRAGVISVVRICATRRYFGANESGDPSTPHLCHLMELPLREADLRVDCQEYEPAETSAG